MLVVANTMRLNTALTIAGQWRNVGGLVEMAPLGGKKSPPSGAPGLRAYGGQFVKKWPKNLNK